MEKEVNNEENYHLQTTPVPMEPTAEANLVSKAEAEVDKESAPNTLSKNQLKRLRKRERWLQIKPQKRKEEKLKKKKKFAEAREKGELSGPTRKSLKKNCMHHSNCKIRVALDCSFDSYMSSKDVVHLVQQIQHSYSANRRADNPLQFYVCGVDGKTKQRLEDIGDYKGWDVYMEDKSYHDTFDKDSIVYLSSESPNVLTALEEDKVYIIGGLVDHNHYKGLCHKLAEEKGVEHAQLPIGEYIEMKSRKVLTVNHVFEILLRYTETGDWQSSFFHVLPQRKEFIVREKGDSQNIKMSRGDIDAKCDDKNFADTCHQQTSDIRETTSRDETAANVLSLESTPTKENEEHLAGVRDSALYDREAEEVKSLECVQTTTSLQDNLSVESKQTVNSLESGPEKIT